MDSGPFPLEKKRFIALVAVLSFGLAALFGALGFGTLSGPIFVLGFFLLIPLALLFGEDLPGIVADEAAESEKAVGRASADSGDPMERLRERYARGEISEAEFERRVERLLETEDLERRVSDRERSMDVE